MTRYQITTAITAYQSYSVDAEDEQAARDKVWDALNRPTEESHAILRTHHDEGYNDDEQIIDSKELVSA